METHPHEVLRDDVQARVGQEVMDVGNATGDGIVDRDHRQGAVIRLHRCEDILK